MRICIFGAGAVGSHFAVRLALAGHDVSCVMRGAHLEAVKANGLTLRVGDAEFSARVKASDDPATLGPQDFVISTLKATGLSSLVEGLPPLLRDDTAVVFAPERHSVVVRYRACRRSSAGSRPRISGSRRPAARRDPEGAYHRRRDFFGE
jgi:ketopantoate reductase